MTLIAKKPWSSLDGEISKIWPVLKMIWLRLAMTISSRQRKKDLHWENLTRNIVKSQSILLIHGLVLNVFKINRVEEGSFICRTILTLIWDSNRLVIVVLALKGIKVILNMISSIAAVTIQTLPLPSSKQQTIIKWDSINI